MVNFRAGVIRSLVATGCRVVVVAPSDAYVDDLKALGAEHVEWRLVGRGTNILAEIAAIMQLRSIYRKTRPDMSFHFTIKPVIYGAIACRSLGIPFVSIVTGLGYAFINDNLVSGISKLLYRITLNWSKEVWLLNNDDRDTMEMRGLLRDVNVRMLPGEGINTTFFAPRKSVSPKKLQFLMVARLLRDKGVFEFVDAARKLLRAGVEAEFSLLGEVDSDNPAAISLEVVRDWESEGIIKYLGVCKDVRPYISSAQCIVLPSYREGIPRSLLEASAMARPVIATDVPGCRDVVLDGKTGFLCAPQSAEALASAIKRFLLLSNTEREKMGEQGRKFMCANFDEKLVFAQYEEAIKKIIWRLY